MIADDTKALINITIGIIRINVMIMNVMMMIETKTWNFKTLLILILD